jgi:hypothetical protein
VPLAEFVPVSFLETRLSLFFKVCLFSSAAPLQIKANVKHYVTIAIRFVGDSQTSNSGNSGGQRSVKGPGNVQFEFSESPKSQNGTDTSRGQIPGVCYRLEATKPAESPLSTVHPLRFVCHGSGDLEQLGLALNWIWRVHTQRPNPAVDEPHTLPVQVCFCCVVWFGFFAARQFKRAV